MRPYNTVTHRNTAYTTAAPCSRETGLGRVLQQSPRRGRAGGPLSNGPHQAAFCTKERTQLDAVWTCTAYSARRLATKNEQGLRVSGTP